mgnify:FL=1
MENEKEVVRGSKATAGKVINGDEIIRQNRRLGQRIMDLRKKAGYSRSDFYALLYPDSNEKPSVKEKRMGEIERGNVGEKGTKIIDFPRLAFIASFCHVSLEWLVFGKERNTQAQETDPEKTTTTNFLNSVISLSRAPTVKDISIEVRHPNNNDLRPGFTLSVDFYKSHLESADVLLFFTAEEILDGLDNIKGALALPASSLKAKAIDLTRSRFTDIPLLSTKSGWRFRASDFDIIDSQDHFDKY